MKFAKNLKLAGLVLLVSATVFFGFHFFFGKDTATPPPSDNGVQNEQYLEELAYLRQMSEKLETELTQLKAEQSEVTKEYEEKIAALEQQLKEREESFEEAPTAAPTYTYTVENNAITITGYAGAETKLSIPSHIDGLEVVAIGREAFKNSALTEVVIPDTVKKLDWFAFYGSSQLLGVAIPTSVTKIEYGAFDGCGKLTICCEKDSYADKYARSYGMRVAN